ncbi:hypothetical protein MLD38_024508 [Melastoma candidum]|uniref:Uncharacterized protein n=1 Tax=Melastoma candidum TaxID=119954 RepID=A0ACB9NSH1_9MYRT|nr:hypothetical protein MLD38_024508 [Melastoma candidum]
MSYSAPILVHLILQASSNPAEGGRCCLFITLVRTTSPLWQQFPVGRPSSCQYARRSSKILPNKFDLVHTAISPWWKQQSQAPVRSSILSQFDFELFGSYFPASMECSPSTQFDILDVYRRFSDCLELDLYVVIVGGYKARSGRSDIRSREAYICGEEIKSLEEESERATLMRHVAVRLLTSLAARISIFDELRKLMSCINLSIDFSEFSCFYDFVFFVCLEKGNRAILMMCSRKQGHHCLEVSLIGKVSTA